MQFGYKINKVRKSHIIGYFCAIIHRMQNRNDGEKANIYPNKTPIFNLCLIQLLS